MRSALRHLGLALLLASLGVSREVPAQQAPAPQPAPAPKPSGDAPKPKPADDDNPFPEAESEAAQKAANAQENADRKPTGGASPASGDNSGSIESKPTGSRTTILDPKLSVKDLQVGQQYLGMGNYKAAYERFKEACAADPDNAEAVFYLAEAARKTRHLDESASNYHIYLLAQPDGPKSKAARKALAQLEGK